MDPLGKRPHRWRCSQLLFHPFCSAGPRLCCARSQVQPSLERWIRVLLPAQTQPSRAARLCHSSWDTPASSSCAIPVRTLSLSHLQSTAFLKSSLQGFRLPSAEQLGNCLPFLFRSKARFSGLEMPPEHPSEVQVVCREPSSDLSYK